MVQWLRLLAPNAGGPGSIPDHGPRSYMPQLRVCMPQERWKIPQATTKTQNSQINKYFFKNNFKITHTILSKCDICCDMRPQQIILK